MREFAKLLLVLDSTGLELVLQNTYLPDDSGFEKLISRSPNVVPYVMWLGEALERYPGSPPDQSDALEVVRRLYVCSSSLNGLSRDVWFLAASAARTIAMIQNLHPDFYLLQFER